MTTLMNMGEAASAAGVSARMIGHHEQIGLLPAAERSDSGYRLYRRGSALAAQPPAMAPLTSTSWHGCAVFRFTVARTENRLIFVNPGRTPRYRLKPSVSGFD